MKVEKKNILGKDVNNIIMNKLSISKKLNKIQGKINGFSNRQMTSLGAAIVCLLLVASLGISMNITETEKDINDVAKSAPETETSEAIFSGTPWIIKINNKEVVKVANEEDAWSVFEGIKACYQTENSEITSVAFDKEIKLEEMKMQEGENIAAEEIMSVDDAVQYIFTGTTEKRTYIVQGGDTIWDIAVANGISPYELQSMNPGLSPEKLHIGQEINLYTPIPFVNVIITEKVANVENIPYEVVYENSDSLYKGQTSVKTPGTSGSKNVISEVTKQNGVIVATNVISEDIISEPIAQVALKGTASVPTYTGSGTLMCPVAKVEISSPYLASRGSRRHLGIDLRSPKGSSIFAADAGVVTFAGYKGSYGNIVKIDHGNGLETRYAHCSSMCVNVGDAVEKGQVIATVGRTGNATGNLLHYEVLVNGVNQNPANYI